MSAMRKVFVALFLLITSISSAKTYYVSTNGKDSNPGTISQPWLTWHYAFNHTTPSDTCYFRGGIYPAYSTSIGVELKTTSANGTHSKPTCFFAYPADWAAGNYPVLDCQIMNNAENNAVEISRASNIHIKGLTVKNALQTNTDLPANGWLLWSETYIDRYAPNNIRFENCIAHNIAGSGFKQDAADTVFYLNCDAYNNCDLLTAYDPGGAGAGFTIGALSTRQPNADLAYTYLFGCRAWMCSDQGFTATSKGKVRFDYCWAIHNGDMPFEGNTVIKGSGWKLWYNTTAKKNSSITQVVLNNCIAAYNAFSGINWTDHNDPSMPEIRAHIYNNFFYGNCYQVEGKGTPWGYGLTDYYNTDIIGRYDHLYYNNLSYNNGPRYDEIVGVYNGSNNLFDVSGSPVTNGYFESLDTVGMLGVGARQTNGSLPATNFGKPSSTSPLIDAGINIGLEFNGSAPDIGWVESTGPSTPIPTPLYVSAVIENATPARLEMTYNLSLATIVPAASAFTVMVNSSARTISSVSISGTKVLLTLASPVVYGDAVTVAYTKPSTNHLQTTSGGQAASITAKNVTNNVAAVTPVYVSSAVENATPARVEMTYNQSLATIVPVASAFTVMVNSSVRTVSAVTISGTKVLLTLAIPVVYGDAVTVAYTKPSTNPLQTTSGEQAASITAKNVTNNVAAVTPVYVSSAVENGTPARVEMTYNLSLATVLPAASAFTVMVNSSTRTVNTVAISGTKVLLTLASPVVYGDVVTVAYTKPSTNPLQTTSGGQAASITAKNVTNNVAAVTPVYVSSAVENATPARVEMTYNLSLATIVPVASAFTVMVNSSTRTVSAVAISGTKVLLTLASPVVYGNAVTVAYTKPSANPLQTTSGGQAASITAKNVTNNVAAVTPVYVSSAVDNATPARVEMTYNLSLATIVPVASAFTVMVNSSVRTVSAVAISGAKVLLTLASPVVYGDAVTVAYTKPSANPLQTTSGGQAASITFQQVINNCSIPGNQPPVVSISSPTKSAAFITPATITIDAAASDPDGTINKVEFFQGTTKLGERTTTPYSFTWKEVPEGTYSLTAAATDNQNLRTVSSPVIVVVEKSVTTVNQLPVVSITSPSNGKKHKKNDKIVIEAVASDPDGSISKVEFKSGGITLAEVTSAPYLYVWEAADTGLFLISAVATDNLGATSASANLDLIVDLIYDANSEIINLYPNPNDGHFTIDLISVLPEQSSRITIVSLAGATIYNEVLNEGVFTKAIDMSGSASGTYILMVTNDQNIVTTKKIIKQ